eukprot:scaffold115072_cov21-Tisochrysis_lutea.AAC.4
MSHMCTPAWRTPPGPSACRPHGRAETYHLGGPGWVGLEGDASGELPHCTRAYVISGPGCLLAHEICMHVQVCVGSASSRNKGVCLGHRLGSGSRRSADNLDVD